MYLDVKGNISPPNHASYICSFSPESFLLVAFALRQLIYSQCVTVIFSTIFTCVNTSHLSGVMRQIFRGRDFNCRALEHICGMYVHRIKLLHLSADCRYFCYEMRKIIQFNTGLFAAKNDHTMLDNLLNQFCDICHPTSAEDPDLSRSSERRRRFHSLPRL